MGFLFTVLLTGYLIKPKRLYRYKLDNRDIEITIEVGDAFDILKNISNNGALVIPINTTFETDLNGHIPKARSIQGKFTRLFYNGNPNDLERDIQQELSKPEYTKQRVEEVGYNNRDKYCIGTVVQIRKNPHLFYLLASSNINNTGRAECSEEDVNATLKSLWEYISNKGDKGEVIIPIIGTQHGRVPINREAIIQQTIRTFIQSATSLSPIVIS